MDKLEELGWEKEEDKQYIEYRKVNRERVIYGLEYLTQRILIHKRWKTVEMVYEHQNLIKFSKKEILALAEILNEIK